MQLNSTGWVELEETRVCHCPSPNFNHRPDIKDISLLVIHNISLPPSEFGGGFINQFFCNQLDWTLHPYFEQIKSMEVSSHFLIERNGELVQYVSVLERAWHAGLSEFQGRANCNDFSIGIELEGCDDQPFTEHQYQSLVKLTKQIIEKFPTITRERIVGHCDIAPGRKTDPGPCFEWSRYLQAVFGTLISDSRKS